MEDPEWNDWINAGLPIYWHNSPEASGLYVKKSDIHEQYDSIFPSEIITPRSLLAHPGFHSANEIYCLEHGNLHLQKSISEASICLQSKQSIGQSHTSFQLNSKRNILILGSEEGKHRQDTSQKCSLSFLAMANQ